MKTGLLRNTSDEFFTNTDVALDCIKLFKKYVSPQPNDIIIEPSAGSGSFSLNLTGNVFAFDIISRHNSIIQKDFLTLPHSDWFKNTIINKNVPIHVIGNPPFGRQSCLAKKFIKLCCSFSTSVSFILPKSFKKESFQQSFPPHYSIAHQVDLPPMSFTIGDKSHDVPCVFQVWKQGLSLREPPPLQEPKGFVFCHKDDGPDFALRRVGVYAGKLLGSGLSGLSHQSHYFIKINKKIITGQQFVLCYGRVTFDHNNTVGPRSISKKEFIAKINSVM